MFAFFVFVYDPIPVRVGSGILNKSVPNNMSLKKDSPSGRKTVLLIEHAVLGGEGAIGHPPDRTDQPGPPGYQ